MHWAAELDRARPGITNGLSDKVQLVAALRAVVEMAAQIRPVRLELFFGSHRAQREVAAAGVVIPSRDLRRTIQELVCVQPSLALDTVLDVAMHRASGVLVESTFDEVEKEALRLIVIHQIRLSR